MKVLIFYGFLILGIIFTFAGFKFFKDLKQFKKNGFSALGEVVGLVQSMGKYGRLFFPKIKFTTKDGKEIIFVGSEGSDPPTLTIGESINIVYLLNDPEKAKIDSFVSNYVPGFVVLFFAILFSVIGGITLYFYYFV